ncbi:LysR family transcriptional regulator [Photobacterium minamisatsumaniensis]|uniref:LysR family transcriptional regulator n=1 Tax=Photobacterium minamisatsumaniensis TaxID=2910233 RepID=UPI003D14C0FC
MDKLNDVALDFNLLRIFQVLYITRSTVETAEKLNISQSQVSRSLQKMRAYYDDVLFIRTKQGFSPTPLAIHLADVIPRALDIIEIGNFHLDFNPNTSNDEVTIALSPAFQNSMTFNLLDKISKNAPNMKINFLNWDKIQTLIYHQIL